MIRPVLTSLALAAAVAILPIAAARAQGTAAPAATAAPPAAVQVPGQAAPSQGPKISEFKLANGLQVVVVPDKRTPVVTHMIYYKVGSADEPPGKSGIAHFLEHLMFKGTEKNPSGRFSKMLATIGGQENAFTTTDYTGYFQRVPREFLGDVMEFEADRMTGLVLTDANVLPERDVVLEEFNMRVANSPDARMGEQVAAALYLNHPYGRPVIGWRPEIEKLNREDALAFYKQFYGPNNAVVVIAGDVDPEAVKALAEKTYGKIPVRSDIGPRARPQEPTPVAVRQVTLDDPRVAQPSLNRSYLVPSYATAKRGEAEALDVLSQILGSGPNSRLYQRLVAEKRIATSAGAWYQGSAVDATRLGVFGRPTPETSLPDLEKAIDAVIAETIHDGVTADELERAKTRMIADAVYAQDNQSSMARWYGTALSTGSTVQDVLSWPDRIRAVTAEQVRDAAKTWLDKRRSATGYLIKSLPASEEKRS
ncbi:M16 family metallopeptidase [Rhodoplanes roseus]|uniref:Peptidase M16 n=1 Tax=Rhodoplanes roseus TaxID=29409 RepID=A0A327KQN3_9BRAD|nr:pitrilysin family protein [Rhodoplanes roseus]RAI39665.1 peptidase M16 [Rhodoplanes roseus]